MTEHHTQQLRTLLLQQKASILNKASLNLWTASCNPMSGDEADLAQSESHAHISLRLQERDRLLVQKIDRALAQIEAGSFGLCNECGEPLKFKRLLARPIASLCIACKEDEETRTPAFA